MICLLHFDSSGHFNGLIMKKFLILDLNLSKVNLFGALIASASFDPDFLPLEVLCRIHHNYIVLQLQCVGFDNELVDTPRRLKEGGQLW